MSTIQYNFSLDIIEMSSMNFSYNFDWFYYLDWKFIGALFAFAFALAFAFACGIITIMYAYVRPCRSYWQQHGFKTIPNYSYWMSHLRGKQFFQQHESMAEIANRLYKVTNEPFIGIYSAFRPILLVRDPALAQSILATDFEYFNHR